MTSFALAVASDALREDRGSNDLFEIRANHAISNPGFGSYGLSYERFRFGQDLGLLEYRRAFQGTSGNALAEGEFVAEQPAQLVLGGNDHHPGAGVLEGLEYGRVRNRPGSFIITSRSCSRS